MSPSKKPGRTTICAGGVRRAFTLMELILVMVIIAILAAVVVPSLTNFRIGRANTNTATQIIGLSGYARMQSISEGRIYRMVIDPDKGTYQLKVEDDSGAFAPATGDYGDMYSVDSGVKMQLDLDQAPNTQMELPVNVEQDAVQGPLAVADPTVQTPNTLMVNRRDGKDGKYVEFEPSGRTDTVKIILTDRLGAAVRVGCTSPTDVFHVLAPSEMP
jgi:prepilin-type N-terminal cleavage/methylation domain-containing protein